MHRRVHPAAAFAVLVAIFAGVGGVYKDELLDIAQARAAKMSRVDDARARLKTALPALFTAAHVPWPPHETFLRAIKENPDGTPGVVELWARGAKQTQLTLIKSYPICALSGRLGPKRKQGDLQIPEGFYDIEKLNPVSSYHLSLRVGYPNASDKIRGRAVDKSVDLGGDIMVHGNCVTIGCIPLQDEPIEEVYLAVESAFGKKVPTRIHIFPRRLDEAGLAALLATTQDESLKSFWTELAAGYTAFEQTKTVPRISVAQDGAYVVAR